MANAVRHYEALRGREAEGKQVNRVMANCVRRYFPPRKVSHC